MLPSPLSEVFLRSTTLKIRSGVSDVNTVRVSGGVSRRHPLFGSLQPHSRRLFPGASQCSSRLRPARVPAKLGKISALNFFNKGGFNESRVRIFRQDPSKMRQGSRKACRLQRRRRTERKFGCRSNMAHKTKDRNTELLDHGQSHRVSRASLRTSRIASSRV